MPVANCDRDLGHSLEVVNLRSHHHIDVLGAAHDAPSVHRQAADDELDSGLCKAMQQLVEGRFAQLRRAAPVNRISL